MSGRRVLVDASAAFNQRAGIGRYAREILISAIAQMPADEFSLWYASEVRGDPPFLNEFMDRLPAEQVRAIRSRFSRRRADQIWFRARAPIPFQLVAGSGHIAYSPDFTLPFSPTIPRVPTIHDLAFEIVPFAAPEPLRRYLASVVPRQIATASLVATVSETTRIDLMERYKTPAEKIRVVPNGVDARFFDAKLPSPELRSRLNLPANYILTVGTIEPRKNHITLLKAIASLGDRMPVPLVVVGRKGWESAEIVRYLMDGVSRGSVMLLDYVDDRDLPSMYAGAETLVYPSWYEGFGLPVLEALAAGVPVVASDVPAHREIGEGVVRFASPSDPEAIGAAILASLATSERETEAVSLRKARAERYSWDRAGETLATLLGAL